MSKNQIIAAADEAQRLASQGKTWEDAVEHARLRYGVTSTEIRRELGRRIIEEATKP